jgi:hemolysin D
MTDLSDLERELSAVLGNIDPRLVGAVVAVALLAVAFRAFTRKKRPGDATAAAGAGPAAQPAPAAKSQPLPGELTKGMRPKDREFLPAALELLETPPSPVRIACIWVIGAFFTTALAWSYFGKLDIHAVAQGRIHPSGRSKVIQSLEPGKVVAVAVSNGRDVKAGDLLLELDPTDSGADREAQTRELESARAEAARRKVAIDVALSTGSSSLLPLAIPFPEGTSAETRSREEAVLKSDLYQLRAGRASLLAQLAERLATRDKLRASIASRENVIALAKERVDMRSTLNDKGSLSRAMVIEVLSQYEQQVTTQVSEQGQLVETEASIKTIRAKIDEALGQFASDQVQKKTEAERKADRGAQELIKSTAKNERTFIKAPISGTVQQLAITTVGQVVSSGQSLMTIVPVDAPIEIEALVQNQDIGFVKADQEAVIKIDAFPFTRYGTINGKILKVSKESIDEREAQGGGDPGRPQNSTTAAAPGRSQNLVFPATIQLAANSIDIDGKMIPLTPGMSVTVEILTGQRRAIDYVLSPLREVSSNTARER